MGAPFFVSACHPFVTLSSFLQVDFSFVRSDQGHFGAFARKFAPECTSLSGGREAVQRFYTLSTDFSTSRAQPGSPILIVKNSCQGKVCRWIRQTFPLGRGGPPHVPTHRRHLHPPGPWGGGDSPPSGPGAIGAASQVFRPRGKVPLAQAPDRQLLYGAVLTGTAAPSTPAWPSSAAPPTGSRGGDRRAPVPRLPHGPLPWP